MKPIVPLLRNIAFAVFFIFSATQTKAQALSPGDLAIIGCNRLTSTNPFELSIVALADIQSGTTIYISDYPYSNSSGALVNTSNTSEGAITWIPASAVAKGTVFLIKINAATITPVVTGLPGAVNVTGWNSGNTVSTPAPAGGENWFIYQGSNAFTATSFIYGWTNYFTTSFGSPNGWLANGTQVATNTSTSELPPSLTHGTTAVSLAWNTASGGSHGDNNVYTGIQSGTKASLLAAISSYTNWNHDEVLTYQLTSASAGATTFGGNPYFAGVNPAFSITGALPVSLVSFTATRQDKLHILNWSFNNEVNSSYYEIQKSNDGRNFISIGRSNATNAGSYKFTVVNNDNSTCYYRLKMVDKNGAFTYSNITVVLAGNSTVTISAYPNPAEGMINISSNAPITSVTITDLQGKCVAAVQGVQQNTLSLPVQNLAKGTYLVHVQSEKDEVTEKIIKQ